MESLGKNKQYICDFGPKKVVKSQKNFNSFLNMTNYEIERYNKVEISTQFNVFNFKLAFLMFDKN